MADGLREKKKWETRMALMHAALRLFSARGYDNVSPADIAAEANVSTRTFFRYFEHKPDAVFGLAAEIQEVLDASDDVLASMEAEFRAYAGRVAENLDLFRMQAELALHNPPVRIRRLEIILGFEDALYRNLRRESPDVPAVTVRQAATLAAHLIISVMETWVEDGTPAPGPDWDTPLAAMRNTVERMLGRRS
jgi:AcrR family transcriptional regulator